MAYSSKSETTIKENKSAAISDGSYPACIVGYYVSKKAPFEDPEGEKYDAIRFAFQLTDDEGTKRVIQSGDMKTVFAEKSSLYKQISGWCKSTSPRDLWERLERAGIVKNDELNYDNFLGLPVQLMVTMKASKKDASKLIPELQMTPPKKGQTVTPELAEDGKLIPIWKPSFVDPEDEVDATCLEGFEWKSFEKKSDEQSSEDKPKTVSYQRVNKTAKETQAAPAQMNKAIAAAEPEPEPEQAQAQIAPAPKPTMASQRLTIRKRQMPAQTTQVADDENPEMPF